MTAPSPSASSPSNAKSLRTQAGPLAFLVAIFLVNFLSRVILAPLLPAVEGDLGISHAQSGSLFLYASLGYFVALFSSGLVSSRLGHRHTIVVAALAVGVMLLGCSQAMSFAWLAIGCLLMGLAGGFYLPSGIATLTDLVDQRHWGKALAVHELAPNLGMFGGPLLAGGMLVVFSWHAVLVFLGIASLALGLAFWRWGRGGDFGGQAPNPANLLALFRRPASWLLMIMFALGIAGSLGVYTMLPLYLVNQKGLSMEDANFLVALSRVPSIGASFLAGWFADRVGASRALVTVFAATGLCTLGLAFAPEPWMWIFLFLQPTLAVGFFPAGFAAISSLGDASLRALAVSVTVPLGFVLGGGLIPTGIGWMGETLSFSWGIAATGLVILSGVLLAWGLGRGKQPAAG